MGRLQGDKGYSMSFSKTVILLLTLGMAVSALAWFDPDPSPGEQSQKVIITRANTFETYPKNNPNVFSTNATAADISFFDAGDINADITSQYGGTADDTFACAWPITFYVWFQTNTMTVAEFGGYKTAKLQYFQGTDSGESTEWTDIATVTNFASMNGYQGAHFGLVTWYPPATNNVYYLVRVWAELRDGPQNALTNSTNITKDGTISDSTDWNDYEVLLIKSIRYKKPGIR